MDSDPIEKLFERETIKEILPSKKEFIKALKKKDFHIYLGIDPTANKLHLGHIQNILLLKDLQEYGAKVTLLFGEFTGLIGDPTGKSKTRNQLSKKDVKANAKSFRAQISPILNLGFFSSGSMKTNDTWFKKKSLYSFFDLLKTITVQSLIERNMFQERLKTGEPLYIHELLYPVLQGYDSVALNVDAELCGTDQLFNALIGRDMLMKYKNKNKFIVIMYLIEGDGVLMSKTNGTGVFVDMSKAGPKNMFGGVMRLSDSFIVPLLKGCTRIDMKTIHEYEKDIAGVKARDIKLILAEDIVSRFHGKAKAKIATDNFITQFQKKAVPDDATKLVLKRDVKVLDLISDLLKISRSECKRKIRDGAVSINGKRVKDFSEMLTKSDKGKVFKVGRQIYILQ